MRTLKIWTVQLGMLALTAAIPALASASQLYVSAGVFSRINDLGVTIRDGNEQFSDSAGCPIPSPAPCIELGVQVSSALATGGGLESIPFNFLGSAVASAGFGSLRAFAGFGANRVYSGFQTAAQAAATAQSTDLLQFAAPGIGIAQVELHVRYAGEVAGDGVGSSFFMEFGQSSVAFFANLNGWYNEDIVIRAPFDPLGIRLDQRLFVLAQVPQLVQDWSGSGQVNFMNTAQISAIYAFDADGAQITNFTVQSASGTDYLAAIAAVPEPGSWALMLGGAAMLALRTRRRRG